MKNRRVLVPSMASGESGFSLLEALVAVALMGVLLAMLSTITGHWMANWKTGFDRVQSADPVSYTHLGTNILILG